MSESKTSGRLLTDAERTALAVTLRKERLSYPAIARECGYADESGARKAVEREMARLREVSAETAEELRQLDLHNLDELERMAMTLARDSHEAKNIEAFAAASLSVIRQQQRRAKLMGLDAAEAFTVHNTGDAVASLDRTMERLGKRLEAAERGETLAEEAE